MRFLHVAFHFFPLLLWLCPVVPLMAQLNPQFAMSTDTLDGFKRSTQGKPEIITVLDFSGSMSAMVQHPGANAIYHNGATCQFKLMIGMNPVVMGTYTGSLTKGGPTNTYTIQCGVPSVSMRYKSTDCYGPLITPTGEEVKAILRGNNGVLDTSPFTGNPTVQGNTVTFIPNGQWWVRQASHARIEFTNKKTIDLPLPWRVVGAPDNQEPFDAYVVDPHSGQKIWYEFKGKTEEETAAYENFKTGVDEVPGNGQNLIGGDRFTYEESYVLWLFTQTTFDFDSATKPAFKNGIPALTRAQSVKVAVFKTWVGAQNAVHWAYRFIANTDSSEEQQSTINSDNEVGGTRLRSLRFLKPFTGDIPQSIIDMQKMEPNGGTPLTYALANTYAQMMNGSIFKDAEANDSEDLLRCRSHYVVLFTDGEANDTLPMGSLSQDDPFGAQTSNGAWLSTLTVGLGSNFNLWSLAGMAAHGCQIKIPGDQNSGQWRSSDSVSGSGSIESFAPFGIGNRSGRTMTPQHPIQTITVGMNLPASGGKNALLLTAGYGKPRGQVTVAGQPGWDKSKFIGKFDPPAAGKQVVDFYDTQNTGQLITALKSIFEFIGNEQSALATPSVPAAGLRSGSLTYLARAIPANSPMWAGDLVMANLGTKDGKTILTGKGGALLDANHSNAIWSAASILASQDHATRKIYTYFSTKPSSNTSANRHANLNINLSTTADCAFRDDNAKLVAYGGDALTAEKINWIRGKRTEDAQNLTRMGDVINSSPVSIEYATSLLSKTSLSSVSLSADQKSKSRFRVIFVGTNHGFLHAFGELSYPIMANGKVAYYDATATELWSFIPKDFLKDKNASGKTYGIYDQLTGSSGHVFMVDGPVLGYLDEDHSSGGNAMIVDPPSVDGAIKDRAMIIFGMGKGGRSLYALDVTDPVAPVLAWAIIPDDEAGADNANATLADMGLSTPTPALASIINNSNKYQDVLFISGGLCNEEIASRFSKTLGKSILALDVTKGEIYQTWNFNQSTLSAAFPNIGCIPSACVPFDLLGYHTAQRVYFADRSGGVYALGSNKRQEETTINPGLRIENSDPKRWTADGTLSGSLAVRKVWQAPEGEFITTSPMPFLVKFPGAPAATGMIRPAATGVAVGTGDYWDPMDRDAKNPAGGSNGQHTLAVLFDRQDSAKKGYDAAGIPMTNLMALTSATQADEVNPSNPSYFLNTKDGFYVKLAKGTPQSSGGSVGNGYFYEKIIHSPLVMQGTQFAMPYCSLWFNVFNPASSFASAFMGTEWQCGGGGQTSTYRIHDVLRPEWNTGWLPRSDDRTGSGMLFQFRGVSGRIVASSPTSILVPGLMTSDRGATTVAITGGVSVGQDSILNGPPLRMRSWRIVK